MGKRVDVGKGGQTNGKWTGFSHFETALTRLFQHDSTQVVDFPHLAHVRLFLGGVENSRISGRGMIGSGMGERAMDKEQWIVDSEKRKPSVRINSLKFA